jgi:hypothetical protein
MVVSGQRATASERAESALAHVDRFDSCFRVSAFSARLDVLQSCQRSPLPQSASAPGRAARAHVI